MSVLRRALGERPHLIAHLDREGGSAWLAEAPQDVPTYGAGVVLPPDWSEDRAWRLLAHVPAWHLVEAVQPELGSRIRVLGDGWLRQPTERVVVACGAVVAWPGGLADAVLLVDETLPLDAAFEACASRGRVAALRESATPIDLDLYPHVHRRSLRVTLLSLRAVSAPAPQLARLLASDGA